jgi:diguanylate cyclase
VVAKQEKDEQTHKRLLSTMAALQEQLHSAQEEASRDALTGLANRRAFDRVLARWAASGSSDFILAIIDIDNFKQINDTFGHQVGDRVLACLAEALSTLVRSTDIVARFGGDEFAALMLGVTLDKAESRFDELVRKLAGQRYAHSDEPGSADVTFTVSCGIALGTRGEAAGKVLSNADRALYEAKRGGKNRVVCRRP